MRIILFEKGIPIQYNNNEKNIETVFGLNEDNSIIQGFTFSEYLKCNINIPPDTTVEYLENGYLFYSFRYQISYAHFMTQTVPLLSDYINNYSNYKLLVPKHHYNILHKELFKYTNISNDNIILLESNTIYNINNFARRIPHEDTFMITHTKLYIYNLIRNNLHIEPNYSPKRKVYLKRDGAASTEYGNSETGVIRKINNEDELINTLSLLGFEIITFGTKTFEEKKLALSNCQIIISQIGANCMNFIFGNAPKHILLLSNTNPLGETYYVDLMSLLNGQHIKYKLLKYNPSGDKDPTNIWNDAYTINIQDVVEYIKLLNYS